MVPARQGLQRHQGRVVLEVEPDPGGRLDLGWAGVAGDPLPSEGRQLETLGNPSSWADMTEEID